ncbi:MAG TPA: hypothetical protein VFP64_07775, partial [Pyrinomonadaceae bacterium]|nr:hypothetical protein [Pyrinomonadaceae bacterium]
EKWKWCALAASVMVLLSLLPQIHLWIVRGKDWHGAYTSLHGDESVYSAYTNALINGRPRRYDPFTGQDKNVGLPESTFSIQFIPAYAVSYLARLTGASASTAFIILMGIAGLLASLSVFWLLNAFGLEARLSAVGTLFVLCFGGLAGGQGLLGILAKSSLLIPGLPFLRRYQPAAAFSLFFVFNLLVWQALTIQDKRTARIRGLLAGVVLGVLVFCYFYLWTAALAWLVCIGLLWILFRRPEWRKVVSVVATIGALAAIALGPYLYLVSHRAANIDEQQSLIPTHRPDLLRIPEILGALILIALVVAVRRKKIELNNSHLIFAGSLALLPFAVFNQQIITGWTMQPYHYETFILNYAVLIGVVIAVALLQKPLSRRLLVGIATLSVVWGAIEVGLPARLTFVPLAINNERMIPVLLRLNELSKVDGTFADSRTGNKPSPLVFSPYVAVNSWLPTWTSQGTLLDIGGLDLGHVSPAERKEFLYMHLYYSKVDGSALRKPFEGTARDVGLKYARAAIFGHERIIPGLNLHFEPIKEEEIEQAIRDYQTYADSFSREEALKRPLAYAVLLAEDNFDLSNLDRWYEREGGERVGDYVLYRLKLRD